MVVIEPQARHTIPVGGGSSRCCTRSTEDPPGPVGQSTATGAGTNLLVNGHRGATQIEREVVQIVEQAGGGAGHDVAGGRRGACILAGDLADVVEETGGIA